MTTIKKNKISNNLVPALERGMHILEILDKASEGLILESLVERTGYPKNSVYRITMTLLEMGYLLRDEKTRRFHLSRRLLALGWGALRSKSLMEEAIGPMRTLRDKTGETVLLGALADGAGVVLEQILGSHHFKFSVDIGKSLPLHAAAPCKAIMAFLPEVEREKIMAGMDFRCFNANTLDEKGFQKQMEEIRNDGLAVDAGEEIEGVYCIGAPILNGYGYPLAAVWVTGPADRLRGETFSKAAGAVKQCATAITQSLDNGLAQVV